MVPGAPEAVAGSSGQTSRLLAVKIRPEGDITVFRPQEKRLIVNADDFGLSPGVNRGIVEAYRHGIVTSTTLLVNLPAAVAAATLAKWLGGLKVGLHLNLTQGKPASDPLRVPSLVNHQGDFLGNNEESIAVWQEADIRREFQAQMARYLSLGLAPTHVDSHHHIHRHPKVLETILALERDWHLPLRPLDPLRLTEAGIAHPDVFLGYTYFSATGKERLKQCLEDLSVGVTELMCHPGYADTELRERSSWVEKREWELAVLTDPEILMTIVKLDISLINYGFLARV